MLTLGLQAGGFGTAACLVEDGHVVGAVEEDRFSRIQITNKWGPFFRDEFPFEAIAWCLTKHGARLSDINHIAYAWDPQMHASESTSVLATPGEWACDEGWGRTLSQRASHAQLYLAVAYPPHLADIFSVTSRFLWHFVPHLLAQAASAYIGSPFEEAAILCLGRRGERAASILGLGRNREIYLTAEVPLPHSLGLLYERIAAHLGFVGPSGESLLMALGAYGKPLFRQAFEQIITVEDNTQYRIHEADLTTLLGPKRLAHEPIESRHEDIACSFQEMLNDVVLRMGRALKLQSKSSALVLAGPVALNCVLNTAVRDAGLFDDVWVQPAAGDCGAALGAALLVDQSQGSSSVRHPLTNTAFGPQFSTETIEAALIRSSLSYGRPPAIAVAVAARLASGKVVGWFQNGMEFGRHALGSRSILASPCTPEMGARLNQLKDRERFAPIASAILVEAAADWLEDPKPSPFMSFVSRVRPDKRPRVPATSHVDSTVRMQTVDQKDWPLFYGVIEAFGAVTGVPILLNTSFRTRGRPTVCTPADAIECYASSSMDVLALGPFLLEKSR